MMCPLIHHKLVRHPIRLGLGLCIQNSLCLLRLFRAHLHIMLGSSDRDRIRDLLDITVIREKTWMRRKPAICDLRTVFQLVRRIVMAEFRDVLSTPAEACCGYGQRLCLVLFERLHEAHDFRLADGSPAVVYEGDEVAGAVGCVTYLVDLCHETCGLESFHAVFKRVSGRDSLSL